MSSREDLNRTLREIALEASEGLNAGKVWFTQEGAYRVPLGD